MLRSEYCARLFANVIVRLKAIFSISLSIRDQNIIFAEGMIGHLDVNRFMPKDKFFLI